MTKQKISLTLLFIPYILLSQMILIDRMEVNELNSPIGLDDQNPNFSWKINCDCYDLKQTHYQIKVSTDKFDSEKNLIWNSGKIESSNSIRIKYNGSSLKYDTNYYWQITIWTNKNNSLIKSNISSWSTGLMEKRNWKKKWIAVEDKDNTKKNSNSPYFINDFVIKKKIKKANLYITSKGMYEAYINGNKVGDFFLTPGWTSYNNRIQYQSFDVKNLINKYNRLGIIVGKGWYHGILGWTDQLNIQDNYEGNKYAFIAELVITYEDGSKKHILNDKNWKYFHGGIIDSEIYDGEVYNANLIDESWSNYNSKIEKIKNVHNESYDGNIISTSNEMIKKDKPIEPIKIFKTKTGDNIIDFGQNIVGWVEFKSKGNKGEKIEIHHAEILHNNEFYTENLRSAKQINTFIINENKDNIYRPHFTFQGFRYIKIVGIENININTIKAYPLFSSMEKTGFFNTSNKMINRLQKNIEWGLKGNFLDVPTDCPQRDERLGWTGDAQVFFNTASFLRDVKKFFDKWMVDLELDQYDNGLVPSVIPDVLENKKPRKGGSAGWSDAVTIISWNSYLKYGDIFELEKRYKSMKKWVDHMISNSSNGLYKGVNHYGDWLFYSVPNDPGGRSAVSNKHMIAQAFYHYSIDLLIKSAKVLNKLEEVEFYTPILNKANKSFYDEYVTKNGIIIGDTQTAYVLPLKFGILKDEYKKIAFNRLVENVNNYGHLTTGFLGTPYLCQVLSDGGRSDLAIKLLLRDKYPSWLYPVTKGATTIWERWNGIMSDGKLASSSMNSYNHYAYGAIGEWMYNNLLGLKINDKFPGYKRFYIKPLFDKNFNYVKGNYLSNYGNISIEWKRDTKFITLNIEIPANSKSDIILSKGANGNSWKLSNDKLKKYVLNSYSKNNNDHFTIGSGKYKFQKKIN